nr:hypothetical protein [Nitrosomonas nitrosa]
MNSLSILTPAADDGRPVEVQWRDGEARVERRGLITEAPGGPSIGGALQANRNGFPVPMSDLRPTDVVTVPGFGDTSVEVAASMGLLVKDAAGQWRAANTAELSALQKPTNEARQGEDAKQERTSWMTDDEEAQLSAVYSQAPDEATRVAVEIIEGGEAGDTTMNAFASRLGIAPEQAAVIADQAGAAYFKEAVAMTADRYGYSADGIREAFAWAAERGIGREAMQQHFTHGRSDYGDVVMKYMLHSAAHDPARWLEADMPAGVRITRDAGSGELVFNSPKGNMALAAAIRARLIAI